MEMNSLFSFFSFNVFIYLLIYACIYFLGRLDVYNLKEDAAAFAGKRALISFLSWLDYCDQLVKEAQKVILTGAQTNSKLTIGPKLQHVFVFLYTFLSMSTCRPQQQL